MSTPTPLPDGSGEVPQTCEACGTTGTGLVEHDGAWFCPSLHTCDYNANIGWINADIQAGINDAMSQWRGV